MHTRVKVEKSEIAMQPFSVYIALYSEHNKNGL